MERAGHDVRKALRLSQHLKDDAVRREGVGTDIPMLLHLLKEGVLLGTATVWVERAEMLQMVMFVVALSDADQVVHVSEAYATYKPMEVPEHGDLARAFAEGDPRVVECLNAFSLRADGAGSSLQASYTYAGRKVVWGELIDIADDSEHELGGDIPKVIRLGYRGQKARRVPALNPTEITQLVGCPFVTPTFKVPRRNDPCPCGSTKKAKFCCWPD